MHEGSNQGADKARHNKLRGELEGSTCVSKGHARYQAPKRPLLLFQPLPGVGSVFAFPSDWFAGHCTLTCVPSSWLLTSCSHKTDSDVVCLFGIVKLHPFHQMLKSYTYTQLNVKLGLSH